MTDLDLGVKIGDETIPILLYADDVVVLANNEAEMQVMLDAVDKWCKRWHMLINMAKSKAMHFRPSTTNQCMRPLYLGNKIVDYTENYKYLGVIFTEHLSFLTHCNTLAESSTRALGAIISKLRSVGNMGYQTFSKCVESCVYPVMEYGAEVWGGIKDAPTDLTQMKAIRAFLGVHKFAPNLAIIGDMGWCPAYIRRKISLLRYWNRLVKLDNDRMTKKILNAEYSEGGQWCKDVKQILEVIECLELYTNKLTVDLELCKRKLMEKFTVNWGRECQTKPKLRTYITIKEEYGCENYVKMDLTRQQRSLLAQLRCGILPIALETGRFTNTAVEDRLCKMCTSNSVENELHFTLICPLYKEHRDKLLRAAEIDRASSLAEQFKTLFEKAPRKLAKYIVDIWNKRKEAMFVSQ